MAIKAVLFDLFDTLLIIKKNHDFYSPSLTRMYKFLNQNGIDVSLEKFQEAHAKARDQLYAKADLNLEEPHFKVRLALTLKLLGYNCDASSPLLAAACAEWCQEFLKFVDPDKDAEPLLRSLCDRYKLGIVSNYAIPECADTLLAKYGLTNLFGTVIVSGAVNKRKPSPKIFKRALNELGVSAGEAVFVGDTLDADVEGGKSAGMKAIYIKRRDERPVETVVPDFTVTSLAEIPPILQKLRT
jgi:HAD superfamily hydrolase (TIGR01549 family)